MEISYLREVLKSYKKIIREHDKKLRKKAKEWQKISEKELDAYGQSKKDLLEDALEEQAEENEEIQQILARSFILAICMTIEHRLGELCKHIQNEYAEKISMKDFRGGGRGIKSRIEYLEAVTQKKFMPQNMELALLIELRNIIVHDNGIITDEIENALKSKYKTSVLKPGILRNQLYFDFPALEKHLDLAKKILSEMFPFWTYEK